MIEEVCVEAPLTISLLETHNKRSVVCERQNFGDALRKQRSTWRVWCSGLKTKANKVIDNVKYEHLPEPPPEGFPIEEEEEDVQAAHQLAVAKFIRISKQTAC